ncbi:Uncharacterised protein [BD1-7 clade bacterium]|uniref:Uncharacterized protein n=1 Tax=BD1-7 clade bacterium TaxID=2029982 RepID=A0A5S9QCF3_9GAMM|nr:Uncharacterised protein [BD1-7 clade bacterium]
MIIKLGIKNRLSQNLLCIWNETSMKPFLILLGVFMISACGSGGSSSNSNDEKPATPEPEAKEMQWDKSSWNDTNWQ